VNVCVVKLWAQYSERLTAQQMLYKDWLPVGTRWYLDAELCALVTSELAKLNGVSKLTAEYRLIQIADDLPLYGASYHTVRNSVGATLNVAATSSAVVFFSEDWKQMNRCVAYLLTYLLNFVRGQIF